MVALALFTSFTAKRAAITVQQATRPLGRGV